MVYKGRILADEKLISDYNVANDHTIILVKTIVNIFYQVKKFKKEEKTTTNTNTTTTNTNTSNTNTSNTNTNPNPFSNLGQVTGFPNMGNMGNLGNLNLGNLGQGGNLGGMGNQLFIVILQLLLQLLLHLLVLPFHEDYCLMF